jgi:hypothetical protein
VVLGFRTLIPPSRQCDAKKYTVAVVMMMMVLLLMMITNPTLGWWLGVGSCLAIAGWGKPGRQFDESGASQPRGRLRYPG